MATVHLQRSHAEFTAGEQVLQVKGDTVGQIINELERRYPGLGAFLRTANSVAINSEIIANGQFERVDESADVHFIARLSGG